MKVELTREQHDDLLEIASADFKEVFTINDIEYQFVEAIDSSGSKVYYKEIIIKKVTEAEPFVMGSRKFYRYTVEGYYVAGETNGYEYDQPAYLVPVIEEVKIEKTIVYAEINDDK